MCLYFVPRGQGNTDLGQGSTYFEYVLSTWEWIELQNRAMNWFMHGSFMADSYSQSFTHGSLIAMA
jgi:hypothetical protein